MPIFFSVIRENVYRVLLIFDNLGIVISSKIRGLNFVGCFFLCASVLFPYKYSPAFLLLFYHYLPKYRILSGCVLFIEGLSQAFTENSGVLFFYDT